MENKNYLEELSILQKYIILLLGAGGNQPIKGNTHFQKEVFLLCKNFNEISIEASFEPDMYGPYSEVADEQLDELEMDDFVIREGQKAKLSNEGLEMYKLIIKTIDEERLETIDGLKALLNDLTPPEILTLIYASFPEFTEESWVKSDIDLNSQANAIKLYKKGKISLQKAAEISNIPISIFAEKVQNEAS